MADIKQVADAADMIVKAKFSYDVVRDKMKAIMEE